MGLTVTGAGTSRFSGLTGSSSLAVPQPKLLVVKGERAALLDPFILSQSFAAAVQSA